MEAVSRGGVGGGKGTSITQQFILMKNVTIFYVTLTNNIKNNVCSYVSFVFF